MTDIRYQEGCCVHCGNTVVDPAARQGPPVIISNQLKTTLTLLRHQASISYRKLSHFCHEVCRISLSPSGVLGIIKHTSEQLVPAYHAIESVLPQQSVLHTDPTRSGDVPKTLLGESFGRLLHSDFYAAYNQFPYTQKCLVHYLRDIKIELKVSSNDKALWQSRKYLKRLNTLGKKVQRLKRKQAIDKGKHDLDQLIIKITQLTSDSEKTQTFIKRAIKYQNSLVQFISHSQAEFYNNWDEQTIHFAVIFRKLSFGHRIEQEGLGYFVY